MTTPPPPPRDRVVVVTGGTGGIGLGVARAFLEQGDAVTIVGSSEERLQRALAALSAFGGRASGLAADLRIRANVETMFERVERERGGLEVLVNSVGINFRRAIAELTEQDYDRVMDTNVKAVFLCCQAAATRMARAGRGGRIVNITSGNYRYVRPGASVYCGSKAAVEMLTRAFALEFGPSDIRVNAVAPGLVDVPSSQSPAAFREIAEYYVTNAPLARLATARDVADAVLFLASDRAAVITGETVVVDGGFSAGRFDFPGQTGMGGAPHAA